MEKYDVICLETLKIQNLIKNKNLSREIQEKSWGLFKEILEQEAEEHGRTIIYIDQWYPSSKTCHKCGHINESLELKDRTWICQKCNTTHHRDINAAKNIHHEGLKIKKEEVIKNKK